MIRFGAYLLDRRVLTRAQLEEATQSQVVFGGRLGTNLVELGYLRLDALEEHLCGHLGLPAPPADWVESPSRAALAAVTAHQAGRQHFLPLALEKRTLHVAMLDPAHPERVDDIAFATGLRVQPYVMSELRLTALLEHHFGVPRDTRFINLGPEAARGRHAPPLPIAPLVWQAETGDRRAVEADEDLIDEATFSSLHANWLHPAGDREPKAGASQSLGLHSPVANAAIAPAAELPAARLEVELSAARDRGSVGRLALRIARLYSDAAALFAVRGGMIAGFMGDGVAIPEDLDGVLIPVDAQTIFAGPATAQAYFRGSPPEQGIDGRVQTALGRRGVGEAVILPVAVRGRVINLLYADASDGRFGDTDFAALAALCGCIGDVYERLVIERKRAIG